MGKKKPFSEIPYLYGNGVELHAVCEDWGFAEPVLTDKWIR